MQDQKLKQPRCQINIKGVLEKVGLDNVMATTWVYSRLTSVILFLKDTIILSKSQGGSLEIESVVVIQFFIRTINYPFTALN